MNTRPRRHPRRSLHVITALTVFALISGGLFAQEPERFFDSASAPKDKVRLVIFYPSVGSLRALMAVKEQGFIPYDNLEIIGVRHAKEKTKYEASTAFVRNNHLDWIKFHAITADLGLDTIYKNNAATDEFRKIFELSNGIIFFGGPDILPAAYGRKTSLRTVIEDPYRHFVELSMIFHLFGGFQDPAARGLLEKRPDYPVLGICLGMQSLNVGTGGTMVQDIWTETYGQTTVEDVIALGRANWHTNPYPRIAPLERDLIPHMLHPIKIAAGSRVWTALGLTPADKPYIMSAHHQAAADLGKGFKVIATSLDGKVIEAVEHERFPSVLGVQFHPEFPMLWDATPRYKIAPEDRDLFGCRTILEANPPSLEFHKRLWTWFFTKVKGPSK